MSSGEFGWESLLESDAPSGCMLNAALLTTYNRADERLLVEHLLPVLLKVSREPGGEGAERQYFLLELDRRLKQLHDRVVVIASTAREEPEEPEERENDAYPWIWRSIRYLTVGRQHNAVQHAKLWLFHWAAADEDGAEYLEIVVSSANLTRAAFRGQLQGAWRACVELRSQPSKERCARWGLLPHFLRELAASSGNVGCLEDFIELLSRADCPEGVEFVASVPGIHTKQVLRRTPWGAAGLGIIAPGGQGAVRTAILSPYIGSWNADELSRWCNWFDGAPSRLELTWIDKDHPWARASHWVLPETTLKSLVDSGAALLHLRSDPVDAKETDLFHEEHRPSDVRWSHAKLYSFRRGPSRRLLVTSANFSTAAWGVETNDGDLIIENFELGVCVTQGSWPFHDLEPFESNKDVATVSDMSCRGSALISWAQAAWDGKILRVECRCQPNRTLTGSVNGDGKWTLIGNWVVNGHWSARISWENCKHPPSVVQLTCETETVNVPIFDERPIKVREHTLPPEVDEDLAQAMHDELLFEQYGGLVADDNDDGKPPEEPPEGGEGTPVTQVVPAGNPVEQAGGVVPDDDDNQEGVVSRSDYGVPAFDLARSHLAVVDNWAEQVARAERNKLSFEIEILQRDGELLRDAFKRQAARDGKKGPELSIGADLAAEEIALRLKHFPEA